MQGVFGNAAGTATIKPGGDPGLLASSLFTPHPTTTLRYQINGTGRGTTYDSIDALNDTVTIAGTLALEIGGGFVPQHGQTFTLLHGNLNDPPTVTSMASLRARALSNPASAGTSLMPATAALMSSSRATASRPPACHASGTAAPAAIRAGPRRLTGRATARPHRATILFSPPGLLSSSLRTAIPRHDVQQHNCFRRLYTR